MVAKQPMVGRGIFQWNTGDWFGAQIGSTFWMLGAALWMAWANLWLAILWLLSFTVVNGAGTWLWLRRDRIAPSVAVRWLFMSITVGGLLILISLDWF